MPGGVAGVAGVTPAPLCRCAPSMGTTKEVKVLTQAGHRKRSEPQLRKGDRPWGGSGERSRGPTSRNRMRGGAGRGERSGNREASMAKAQAT